MGSVERLIVIEMSKKLLVDFALKNNSIGDTHKIMTRTTRKLKNLWKVCFGTGALFRVYTTACVGRLSSFKTTYADVFVWGFTYICLFS